MKKSLGIPLTVLFGLACFVAGARFSGIPASEHCRLPHSRVLYYVDPLNPAHKSDQPGLTPYGLKLDPVYENARFSRNGPSPLASTGIGGGSGKPETMAVPTEPVSRAKETSSPRVPGWSGTRKPDTRADAEVQREIDPVCKMPVLPDRAARAGLAADYRDKTHYFCSRWCKERFQKMPQQVLSRPAEKPIPLAQSAMPGPVNREDPGSH
ncbi:MAG TPA: YHS domain-containing protein [Syntrophobacteraceae bacterium]|nr:YHS domain-containing protein [Syntrophobacteraceae bacterium]